VPALASQGVPAFRAFNLSDQPNTGLCERPVRAECQDRKGFERQGSGPRETVAGLREAGPSIPRSSRLEYKTVVVMQIGER
jgi:hypothetical protein